ncbi:hypothetical protein ORI89_06360 [Sphingobacterium sp. UT-1RO-CII-1]|uniref:DUF6904 family protein n=1 Tax=Sphingobacterium sp. UT-1RO-CII-1 TaxID=2995225 RepID=UPI00227B9C25|nr:hypothetical protein [Sphingobacterium sp. UT-1RO-CII-1]MCY4779265.1 hypothetical protein [Sphingobacterium sp. UT-1RO-CII-1]
MIQGYPSKNGTGINIYGDYADLNSLYETVHKIASTLSEADKYQKGQHKLLMNFAYEIRKAFSGQRIKDKLEYIGDDTQYTYYGFQLIWTDILIFLSTLRFNAGFTRNDGRDQANLYILEHILEEALFAYDPRGANSIKEFISQRIDVTNQHVFIIYQAIHIEFVNKKLGKTRFRNIPKLLNSFFLISSPEYQELIASFQTSATEQQCEIGDLEFSKFPEIKW